MPTIIGPVRVPETIKSPGWDYMIENNPTRALVLLALTNLEIKFIQGNGLAPTLDAILKETIRLQGEYGHKPLSLNSDQTIQRHLDKLKEQKDIVTRVPYTTNRSGGQGGPTSPWHSAYIEIEFRQAA